MVLVPHDAVVMLATSVTASTGVLAVLTDTTMTGADVPALLTVFVELQGRARSKSSTRCYNLTAVCLRT